MKKLLFFIIIAGISGSCATVKNNVDYETVQDGDSKILKGTITRSLLQNDPAYSWFTENMKYGTSDSTAVQAFKNNAGNFNMIVFVGTWCEDSKNLLPVFYRLVDKSDYPDSRITLIGVDRAKTAPKNLHTKYKITNVPTFIVIRNGKEIGRVVEYGKTGSIDKELGGIVASTMGK